MLELVDPTPFTGVEPLKIGDVPLLNTDVIAVGYPIGGERISVTRGVVSRIDFRNYSHSGVDMHLTIQVDAAINPGNSGGPVLQDEKVVGVAFQGYSGSVAQNVGYMIPTPVIKRFLEDTKDGSYDHYVDLSLSEFQIQNPAQLKALGLPNNGIGVIVSDVDSGGSSGGKILPGDVLLAIDGNPIFNNGLINVDGDLVNMNEIVERKFAGDTIGLKVWRDKKAIDVEVTLKPFAPYRVLGNQYGKRPQYLVFCGLVFQPMDRAVIAAHTIEDQLVNYYFNYFTTDEIYKEHPEVIILTKVLTDAVNSDVGGFVHKIVDEVDGKKIRNLSDLNTAFTDALAKPDGGFITIKLLEEGRPIVLDRARAKEAHTRILQTYGVAEDHFIDPTRTPDTDPSSE